MPNMLLVVVADPAAPYLAHLSHMPQNVQMVVTDDLEQLKKIVPQAEAILYASLSPVLVQILPLADWVVAAMLFFAFDFGRIIRQQGQRVWQPFISSTLEGRTLGILGYGSIGSARS